MIATRLYRKGVLERENFPIEELSDHLGETDVVVWADFISPTEDDLAVIEDELGLHELAIEDAVHEYQRPKLDRYDSHFFLAAYSVDLDTDSGELTTHEVKAFIAQNAIVTVHAPEFDMGQVTRRWDQESSLTMHGVACLVWGLLDAIVDSHFAAVQALDSELEEVEDSLFDDAPRPTEVQRRSFELRKSLVLLRRVVLPMREVVNTLIRRDLELVTPPMQPYFQDVYDHVLRATEWTESLRDLVTTILETNVSIQGNRMNLIMKKVTSWAAIIAVPTAITGFFGQNVAFPGFGTGWGVTLSLVLIAVASVALYVVFKRRDWL